MGTTTAAPTAAPTTTSAPTAAPTTTAGPPPSSPSSYTQDWLRGDTNVVADPSHVHEGLRLAAGDGWVGVGGTIGEVTRQVIIRKINNAGEYLSVDMNSGVVMIYTDSDSIN